jgi:nitroreductase
MELRDALRSTGAVRRFTDAAVDDATVAEILDDARFAPSGGNRQPWRVAVVRDVSLRRRLADAMRPVWDEYLAAGASGQVPYNVVSFDPPAEIEPGRPNPLLDSIADVPVVLVVAADLSLVAMMDAVLDRAPIAGGASVYPFCWNLLLAARARGLGGVMTTFLSRVEPLVRADLALPRTYALAATIFLGAPEHQPTKLRRAPVDSFATRDRFDGSPFGR